MALCSANWQRRATAFLSPIILAHKNKVPVKFRAIDVKRSPRPSSFGTGSPRARFNTNLARRAEAFLSAADRASFEP